PNNFRPCLPSSGFYTPNSIRAYGGGPERLYSHGMGGTDRFYSNYFQDDGRDLGYGHNMAEGPWGRVAPYSMGTARQVMAARRRM
ncbi:hypothetical protein EK21DRAFT_34789, partial [Setomelanomma holmii]